MKIAQFQNRFHKFSFVQSHWQLRSTSFSLLLFILLLSSSYSSLVQAKATLLIMGDSLSAAYGMEIDQGWVSLLAKKPEMAQIKIVNASLSGDTSSGGKQRLPLLMSQHKPQWLILELGINDAFRGQNLKHTQQNLQQMIDLCLQQQCKVLLLGNHLPTNYGPGYDALFQKMYRQLADKNTLIFDPFFLETVVFDPNLLQADGLHPNATAQPLILQRLLPYIHTLLETTTSPRAHIKAP